MTWWAARAGAALVRVHDVAERKGGGRARVTIGVIERVTVVGPAATVAVHANIDTGPKRTTLDTDLAKQAGLGPVLRRVRTRAAAAETPEVRDVVRATVIVDGRMFDVAAAVTDRKDMTYHVIVGMDVLGKSGFLISPRKGAGLGKGRPLVKSEP